MSKYEIITIEDRQVTFDVSTLIEQESVMINATQIAKQFGKVPHEWLSNTDTKEYIEALTESLLKRELPLQQDLSLVRVQKGGRYSGTWIHSELAIDFARWLDPKFAVMCDMAIKRMIKGEQQRKDERLKAKTGYQPLTLAIQSAHLEPKFYHYSNEANLINRIILGKDAKEYKAEHGIDKDMPTRDYMTSEQLYCIEELQKYDTVLLTMEYDYNERKDLLMVYYVKLIEKKGRLQQIKQKQIAA